MNSEFDVIYVMIENNLIFTKSKSKHPKNIADFMPDYNLWYALKFVNPKKIIIVENINLLYNPQSSWYFTKIQFITEWLREMTRAEVWNYVSERGNWVNNFGYEGEEEILDMSLRYEKRHGAKKCIFIDRNTKENENYVKEREIMYTTKEEFIKKYNKNPRVYEKGTDGLSS